MSQQLSKFHLSLLQQLFNGPAAAVALKPTGVEDVQPLVEAGLVEVIDSIGRNLKNILVIVLTDAGIAFCHNSGSNMVH